MALRHTDDYYQRRGSVIETVPATEPVTAAELRTFLRETATGLPDAEADEFITQARQEIERSINIAMITQSWRMSLDQWPIGRSADWWAGTRSGSISELNDSSVAEAVKLPVFPLISVTSVTTYDQDSNPTVVTVADVFDIDIYRTPARMALQSGASWPTATRSVDAIQIIYVSGYGLAAADVPATLIRAVKQLAAYYYAHRGDGCDMSNALKESGAASAIASYKVTEI